MSPLPDEHDVLIVDVPADMQVVGLRELGQRIRQFRLEKRLTLKQVEERSGLSATHLSEIERGRTSPTIGALTRIARSLDKDPSYFIECQEMAEVSHVPYASATRFTASAGVTAEAMTNGIPGNEVFAYRLTFASGPSAELSLAPQEAPSEALYLVRRGVVEAEIGGRSERLGAGDAAHGRIGREHRLRCGGGGAEVIAVLTRPLEPAE